MKLSTLVLITILTNLSLAQSNIIWSEDFETEVENYYDDTKYPTIIKKGDTLIVVGQRETNNTEELQVVNYNLLGDTISTSRYGSDSVSNNILISYEFDSTGHVYLLHQQEITFNKYKIVLQKYTVSGNLMWVEQIQEVADTSYIPRSLAVVNDTCLLITAYKSFDYPQIPGDVDNTSFVSYLYAYNSDGNQFWQREFNPINEVSWFAHDIFIHNETAHIFANNYTATHCLIKVDLTNNITTNLNTGLQNGFNDVQLTSDNNLLIVAGSKYRISKCDLNGNVIWSEYYGTNLPLNVSGDEIIAVIQDSNGDIYATGRHYGDEYGTSNYSNADILTIKYNSNGTILWENRFEYGINNADIGSDLTTRFGKVYVGGRIQRNGIGTDYDYAILEIDSIDGVLTGGYMYNGSLDGDDIVSSLCIIDNGNIALTGLSGINQNYDWTTQLIGNLTLGSVNLSNVIPKEVIQIFDITGRETEFKPNTLLIYIYSDGTSEKMFKFE